MGGLVLETASQISKFFMISMKTCYKSVGNHPFVVGILLFFIFLHRSFPVLFSFLVSTSPVLVCTAVLLGTLLSFGQSNIPEIEPQVDVAPLRTWVSGDDTVLIESGGSFPAEKRSATSRDIVADESTTDYRVNGEAGDHDIYAPLIIDNVQHQTESDNRVIEDVDRDIELPNDVEAAEQQYSLLQQVRDQILQVQDGNGNVSPQGGRKHYDDSGDDSGEASDSGSDGAESSSPDASMADILPVLDELHPLIDLEAPQPAHMSNDGSDAASDSSVESDEDNEEQGGRADEEDGVDYHGGDEEEVPEHSGKEDESKSAIKWTDDDQKNLMDLGNLELERNRRLENLIARRRARKSFKLMSEKNLIDFGGVDLPFNVSPISTTRRNPFDSPFHDSYGDMGLPPIPGSAPSIMLARRNPFDLPYDSNEEKPDLKGDHFEQEFIALHANDAFFRRHESFSLGASSLGGAKHERQDFKWKPVFVPERLASEGPGYSLFQRQSSEVSESKLSSVRDSDSVSSAADLDDRKFSEQDFTTEAEVISNIYHVSGLVNHGSHSYEDVYSLEMEQVDKRDVLPDQLDIELGASEKLEPSLSDNGGLRTLTNELHLNPELVEEEDSSSSSSLSSLSEADEKISDVRDVGKSSELSGDLVKEYLISAQHSLEESDIQFISTSVDDNQLKEPVYDSVPLEAENLISLNSISSDMQAEIYELVRTQSLVEMHVPFVYKDNDVDCKATSANGDVCGATSKAHGADAIQGDLGNYNQAQLISSLSEVEDGLPRNLEVNAVSSQSRYHYLLSNEQTSEQEKDLSWLDKSMVEPCLDDHMDALIIKDNVKEEVDDIKEIDPELLLELDTVGDFSVKDVIGEPLHYELVREVANAVSSESGLSTAELNLSEPNQELPILDHIHEGVDIDEAFKEIHAGVNAEEVMFPGVVDNEQVSESTVHTSSQLLTTKATSLEDIITSSNQAPDNSANEFSQLPDTEGSVELHLVLPLEGNGVSADALPDVVEDTALYSIGSTDQETFTTQIHLKQLSEENVTKLLDTLDSEDVLAEVGAEAVVETVLSNDVFGVKETITDSPLKQVSEANVAELINPLNSNDETSEVGTAAVVETVSSNVSYGVDETIPDSPLKQLSDGTVAELPNPSNSKNETSEVGTEAVGQTASSNVLHGVEETIPDSPLKLVSEDAVCELQKPLNLKDGCEEVTTVAVVETVSSNASYGIEETIPDSPLKQLSDGTVTVSSNVSYGIEETISDSPLKQLSDGTVAELPNPSNSKNEMSEVGTEAVVQTVSSNVLHGVEETIPDSPLKLVSEDAVCELQKPLNLKDGCEEVTNTVGDSVEEIGSNNTGSDVPKTVSTPSALKEVSESFVVETIEMASDDRELVQEPVPTQVSEKNVGVGVGELPKPSNSNDGLTE